MIQFLLALALCYVLVKIPFWVLGSLRGGSGRSMVGSLIRGFIAYKTMGLAGSLASGAGRSLLGSGLSAALGSRSSATGGGEAAASGGGFLTTLNPVAAMRRRHQRRWIDPEPGMLRMKLRRPEQPNAVSATRVSVADELDDPDRTMPWQQGSPPEAPGLLGPRGGINPDARWPRRFRVGVKPERGMLNMTLRPHDHGPGAGADPMRRRVADEIDDPDRTPPHPPPTQSGQALITSTGAVNPRARARHPLPEPISPGPGMLPLTLHPRRRPPAPTPAGPEPPDPTPRHPRRQQALITSTGAVNPRARARHPLPEPISPGPGMLPLTLHPRRRPPAPTPADPEPPDPRHPRPQQALINRHGAVTQNARARRPRRRTRGTNTGEQP